MNYRLDLRERKRGRPHPNFHVSRLKRYSGDPEDLQRRPHLSPTAELDNLEIERIIGHQFKSGSL